MQEQIPRAFIDLETAVFEPHRRRCPDPYAAQAGAARKVRGRRAARPAAAPCRAGDRPGRDDGGRSAGSNGASIRFCWSCSILDWPWIKDAYFCEHSPPTEDDAVEETQLHAVAPQTLPFVLGELPFITGLSERARSATSMTTTNLSIDGVKELLLAARERYQRRLQNRGRKLTPQLFSHVPQIRPQPLAHRTANDTRPVHAGDGRPADRRRPVRDFRWPRRPGEYPLVPAAAVSRR